MTPHGGTIQLAGKQVSRVGFGTMRLTGSGTWNDPIDPERAVHLLRVVVDSGITHLDTADAYGPHTAEHLIRRALHPYPTHVLIATKVGMVRPGPNVWKPLGRPEFLRATVEQCLRRLDVDCLELCYLHRIDPLVPLLDQVGTLADLQTEGKIAHIGLSKVMPAQIEQAVTVAPIAAVQNKLNVGTPDDVIHTVPHCRARGIPYIAYAPLGAGVLPTGIDAVNALRWILDLGEHIAAIPGTSSPQHLRDLIQEAPCAN